MLLFVSCKKETDHSDECAIRLIKSLLVVHRIHWRKWGQGRKEVVYMSRGQSYECDVRKRPSWTFTSLWKWFEVEAWCRHSGPSGSSVQLHTACVFMPTDEYMQDEQNKWQQNRKKHFIRISVPKYSNFFSFFFLFFASRWCCSLFTRTQSGTWQHMLSWSPTDMCCTLLKGGGKISLD